MFQNKFAMYLSVSLDQGNQVKSKQCAVDLFISAFVCPLYLIPYLISDIVCGSGLKKSEKELCPQTRHD